MILVLFFSTNVSSNTLLVLGDSLSAGYNMSIEQAWPNLLGDALKDKGKSVTVINGSISGDTTGNGLSRLPSLLNEHQPDTVLIELGANDGLRGFPPNVIGNNLRTMIDQVEANNGQVILMQIRIPPNYGKRYSDAVSMLYPTIAEDKSIPLVPFFLEQVIIKPEWMLADGLHPTAEAQPWIANFMADQLAPLL